MKKSGLLSVLEGIKIRAEQKEMAEITAREILTVLLDYINDPEITGAVDSVPF